MTSTYTQKSDPLQRIASHNAASIMDSSAQGASLQRKADMLSGPLQRVSLDEEEPIQNMAIQRETIPDEEEELA